MGLKPGNLHAKAQHICRWVLEQQGENENHEFNDSKYSVRLGHFLRIFLEMHTFHLLSLPLLLFTPSLVSSHSLPLLPLETDPFKSN